jgi:outer membrane protein TolC
LNLFDGFLRQTKVKDSKSAILQEEFKLKSVDQQIVNDVESAYSNLVLAKKKFEIAQKSVEVAREVYELTKLQYEEGITSYFFLQQKESELTQAEYSNINALYNLRLTGARLQNAIGK